MEKDNFFKNSFLLTASNITTGILGFIFSINLSKLLGAEGMGLYNLVMPLYNLFICLMTAGIVAAISRVSAVYSRKKEYGNLDKTIKTVAIFNFVWAIIIGILVFAFAPFIVEFGVSDSRTINAIRVACPAMVFIALSNILKGYFLGLSKIKVPAIIDILEKGMRIITIGLLVFSFNSVNLKTLVTLAYISLAIGEMQSLILLYFYYRRLKFKNKHLINKPTEGRVQLLFNVLVVSLPLCLNGFIGSIFSTLSTLIVPKRLIHAGFTYGESLSMIGRYSGMAVSIIAIPLIVVGSINSLLVPDLSQSLSRGNEYEATKRINTVMKIAFILGIATAVICNLVPNELGSLFFDRVDLGNYIKASSLAAPIFFLASTMFGILNGLNKQGTIVKVTITIAVVELISLFVFTGIPSINIYSYSISLLLTSLVSLFISIREIKKVLKVHIPVFDFTIFLLIGILFFSLFKLFVAQVLAPLKTIEVILLIILSFSFFAFISRFGTE
ncbi:stage V sporulation protein B [Clostridium chrysemydis]|uniref:stage V sporulation protein B n=1 Tax=Clostridium chrysemydis TaxID=2665504 RepID=UPI00188484A0|nr:stage V sporulation protein B [Clostridium chrysemydis]